MPKPDEFDACRDDAAWLLLQKRKNDENGQRAMIQNMD
jgi:hypothetical protein